MIKLIVDSGGTKADWTLIQHAQVLKQFSSNGLQPFVQSQIEMLQTIDALDLSTEEVNSIDSINYYGSCCGAVEQQHYLASLLQTKFKSAEIDVKGDLLGAAIACCGNESGLVGILGTGSNSCFYDGHKIVLQVPSLGFILGDEGSGANIGKELIKSYFYRTMPPDLSDSFRANISGEREEVLNHIYRKPKPNVYLASIAKFAVNHKEHTFIRNLITANFYAFIENQILHYQPSPNNPVHFVGSIAFIWKDLLATCLKKYELELGKIITRPIEALTQYHMHNE
jgi:N-acetylglucosamine kinase-like BadF-type ATPase